MCFAGLLLLPCVCACIYGKSQSSNIDGVIKRRYNDDDAAAAAADHADEDVNSNAVH